MDLDEETEIQHVTNPHQKIARLLVIWMNKYYYGITGSDTKGKYDLNTEDMSWLMLYTVTLSACIYIFLRKVTRPIEDPTLIFDRQRRRRQRYYSWGQWPWSWVWPYRNHVLEPPSPSDLGTVRQLENEFDFVENRPFHALIKVVKIIANTIWEDVKDEGSDMMEFLRRIVSVEYRHMKRDQHQQSIIEDQEHKNEEQEYEEMELDGLHQNDPVVPTFTFGSGSDNEAEESTNLARSRVHQCVDHKIIKDKKGLIKENQESLKKFLAVLESFCRDDAKQTKSQGMNTDTVPATPSKELADKQSGTDYDSSGTSTSTSATSISTESWSLSSKESSSSIVSDTGAEADGEDEGNADNES